MTLPIFPSPISLTQIRDEFSQTGPVNLNNYHAGGGIVAPGTIGYPGGVSTPVPTSGPISLQNFQGTTAIAVVEIQSSGFWTVPTGVSLITLLMAGGGAGGGAANTLDGGGGGGAGGVQYMATVGVIPGASLPVTIGAGGSGASGISPGTAGNNTVFDTLTVTGGGGGGGSGFVNGGSGGSGGGACGYNGAWPGGGGTPGFGNAGGSAGRYNSGGGGGGGSAVGQATGNQEQIAQTDPGKGGAGFELLIPINSGIVPYTGTYGTPYLASSIKLGGGGGGGIAWASSIAAGVGGSYIGGTGGQSTGTPATPGIIRTGSGGGGGFSYFGSSTSGANGSSGVIYIIYAIPTRDGVISTFDSAISTKNYGGAGLGFPVGVAGITLNTNGTIIEINSPAPGMAAYRNTVGTNWYSTTTAGIGSSYWAFVTIASSQDSGSGITNNGTYGSWVSLATAQTWSVSVDSSVGPGDCWAYRLLNISIAASSGGPVIATAQVQLSALSAV